MAELYIIGNIKSATNFIEPNIFLKWSIQCGSSWKFIEGESEGQTAIDRNRFENSSTFSHPIDVHLGCRGIQGWPKLYIEVYAVNALNKYWPIGFGVAHIPTHSGSHLIDITTWKLAPGTLIDSIRDYFHSGGFTVSKNDLVTTGVERFKLTTKSSGLVHVELMTIHKNFSNFGVEIL